MDFNYFDMIGWGEESFLFPLMGIILFPVLFPLYLVLKIIIILIEFLTEVLSSLFTRKETSNNNIESNESEFVDTHKKEQIERQIRQLKEEKRKIEDKIRNQEQELSNCDLNVDAELENLQIENGMSLKLKKSRK